MLVTNKINTKLNVAKSLVPGNGAKKACWRSLERQFMYRKRTDRVAFHLEYSPKVYQSTEQVHYYA